MAHLHSTQVSPFHSPYGSPRATQFPQESPPYEKCNEVQLTLSFTGDVIFPPRESAALHSPPLLGSQSASVSTQSCLLPLLSKLLGMFNEQNKYFLNSLISLPSASLLRKQKTKTKPSVL